MKNDTLLGGAYAILQSLLVFRVDQENYSIAENIK